jgi:polyferredoxin
MDRTSHIALHVRPTLASRRRGGVWRELFLGADESTPPRPGRHLETRQRLGILPTWSFWNRRDIWRAARWFAHPVVFVGVLAGSWIPAWLNLPFWPRMLAAQAIGIGALTFTLGALERYLRKRLAARRVSFTRDL